MIPPGTPDLRIRIKKRADAPVSISLVRADGSSTTGRIGPANGYGPVHDLAHYVVEQSMGLPDAFYGLVAKGWDLETFERDAKGQIPDAGLWAESWAGELSREVLAEQPLSAADFNATVRAAVTNTRPSSPPPEIDAEQLETLRTRLESLWAGWHELPVGGTLECPFVAGVPTMPTCQPV